MILTVSPQQEPSLTLSHPVEQTPNGTIESRILLECGTSRRHCTSSYPLNASPQIAGPHPHDTIPQHTTYPVNDPDENHSLPLLVVISFHLSPLSRILPPAVSSPILLLDHLSDPKKCKSRWEKVTHYTISPDIASRKH